MNIQCLSLNKVLKFSAIVILAVSTSCSQTANNEKIKLYVAAGLFQAMDSITQLYTVDTHVQFEINAASSGTLAKQIEQGAPADIYFSANEKWIDFLVEKGLLCDSCHHVFAGNEIVLINSKTDSVTIDKLKKLPEILGENKKLAMGQPEHVPAGKYAKEALESLKIFNEARPSLIYTKDVRSALILSEMGEAEFAIVYKTDAVSSEKVKILSNIPDSLHSKIDFSVALLATNNEKAKAFYEFISSKDAKAILKHYGFRVEN